MSARRVTSRRHVLLAAGAALVAGAGGTEPANALDDLRTNPSRVVPPGESLMSEHGVLKRVLLIYDAAVQRAGSDPTLAASAIHGGALIIHDFIENFHEALEESFVFPALKTAKQLVSTVDTLLLQHARGRLITEFLLASATTPTLTSLSGRAEVTGAVAAFVRMYEPHEAREDTVVFPAYRALLTPSELNRVGADILAAQKQEFGPDGFEATVGQVARLEQSLGLYDLAQFTPDAVSPSTT
jgi:hemerythrin-like domain-containing protein